MYIILHMTKSRVVLVPVLCSVSARYILLALQSHVNTSDNMSVLMLQELSGGGAYVSSKGHSSHFNSSGKHHIILHYKYVNMIQ